ncbi:PAS domain-containing protein [Ramlibacter sp. USB13]|uniref:histidine kinase n=1 Tax=Ramlibacter cellulosilyticus TaxID=2764187 RepID=A0A923MWV0_9BURK|nr:PAS domain-containing protein [Ramlibacter cellulosilyticus]MBC5786164.1 PAS domain-containing protein [Ramlibacter cellulosilyticus]
MTAGTLFDHPGLLAEAIAQASDDCIFAKDLEGRYRFANRATLAIFGFTAEQVIGRTDFEILGDGAAARRLRENDRQMLAVGQAVEREESLPAPDGSLRCYHTRKMPLRGASGDVVGLLGIARDITERKAAEAQREADRLKLAMGIQAAGLVMADIDYRTNLNHISGELARLLELGDGPLTVPRQAIFDRIHPEDRDRYLDAIRRTLDPAGNGHLAIDVRAQLPSGIVRWLHIRLQIVFEDVDGRPQPVRGICAARDVTIERIAEGRLRAAQRLTQSVIEGAGALVFAKDLQGRYILSNQAWRRLHGLRPEQVQGITDDELFGVGAAGELRANDRRVLETGEPITVEERAVVQGELTVFRSSKFPLYDEAGQVYAVCGVSTDITDVVEADRRKDEFIATLAHELRNPLAPIRTGLEILRRVGELPPTAARTRDMMERQLTHMVRLVDDLLDVSRVSRGKLGLRVEDLTLAQVLDHALESCQPAIAAAGHVLAIELPKEPVRLRGDLTRLAQVFSNLVNNAVKYTPPGGRIDLRATREAGEVVVEVCDNGSGIAPDLLPHVFDLFAQGRGTSQVGPPGLGIGLWLVRKLVELHQGSIAASSAGPGQGSTFRVRLPMAN